MLAGDGRRVCVTRDVEAHLRSFLPPLLCFRYGVRHGGHLGLVYINLHVARAPPMPRVERERVDWQVHTLGATHSGKHGAQLSLACGQLLLEQRHLILAVSGLWIVHTLV